MSAICLPPPNKGKTSHAWNGVFVRSSLALRGSIVIPDEISFKPYMYTFTATFVS